MITVSPHSLDNNKMTFNNDFLVQGNGGQLGVSHKTQQQIWLNITIINLPLYSAAAFVARYKTEKKTIISVGVGDCFLKA